jgi:hypothetical protein
VIRGLAIGASRTGQVQRQKLRYQKDYGNQGDGELLRFGHFSLLSGDCVKQPKVYRASPLISIGQLNGLCISV